MLRDDDLALGYDQDGVLVYQHQHPSEAACRGCSGSGEGETDDGAPCRRCGGTGWEPA